MVLEAPGQPLHEVELPNPEPGPGQVLLTVKACGVCRTDLHVVDGDLEHPALPIVPGHEIVGERAPRLPGGGLRLRQMNDGDGLRSRDQLPRDRRVSRARAESAREPGCSAPSSSAASAVPRSSAR